MIDVVIIGAGPYGLSIAAHLKAYGVDFRIFGSPMRTWLTNMPKGMRLKSEGFASCLYDPDSTFTLGHYCREKGIPYADLGLPVPLETFSSYGVEFQRRFVPQLEDEQVMGVCRSSGGFEIHLEGGEVVAARKIVVAVGLRYFDYIPPVLSGFSEEFVTHSSRHRNLERFEGREVAVIGAGASALDLAALLHQAGAVAHLVARKPVVRFHDPPSSIPPSLMTRIRFPITGIGVGWRLYLFTSAPLAFHRLPERHRLDLVRRSLGPAPGWFVKDQVVGKVPFHLGVTIKQASVRNGRVNLELTDCAESQQTLVVDHVIAATGYKVDLRRLSLLNPDVLAGIQSVEQTPALSSNFESSIPGLYFVGTSAANAFGPLLRFAFGAGFTARRISRHLAHLASRNGSRHAMATA
jgi:thioredoxin reductase